MRWTVSLAFFEYLHSRRFAQRILNFKKLYTVYGNYFLHEDCDSHCLRSTPSVVNAVQIVLYAAMYNWKTKTPGLFKLEHEGDGITSLRFKTYHCFGKYDNTSAKGLGGAKINLNEEKCLRILQNEQWGGKNISFRTLNNHVNVYENHKQSLSFFLYSETFSWRLSDDPTSPYLKRDW